MELLDKFSRYIKDNLDMTVDIQPGEELGLPFYLKNAYSFHKCRIENKPYLIVIPLGMYNVKPSEVKKHIQQVLMHDKNAVPILVLESVPSYVRKRLIQQKISFVVPGNQMYLPNLGIDLREYYKRQAIQLEILSPVAQVVFLYLLINKNLDNANPTELAEKLNYSTMSISRAINELSSLDLASEEKIGRKRCFSLTGDRSAVWRDASNYLVTPVKYAPFVGMDYLPQPIETYLMAGESALAELSMLNPPDFASIAMSKEDWKKVRQDRIVFDNFEGNAGDGKIKVEVWSYDPRLLSNSRIVDPFSLSLSMNYSKDERIIGALEQLIEGYKW